MKAFVTGASGQDGHFLLELLLSYSYEVVAITSREDAVGVLANRFPDPRFSAEAIDFCRPGAIEQPIIDHWPDVIFNLAALATGSGMFANPRLMSRINGEFVLDILEVARTKHPKLRICQASSAEMFGDTDTETQDEQTCFRPKSPYGAAKTYAHNLIGIYRSAFDIHCSSAILFNHESIRRPDTFVTRKIAKTAAKIKLGLSDSLSLASLDSVRDWGFAPEYVNAMFLMASNDIAGDYVVATGRHTSLRSLCEIAFGYLNLDYQDYVRLDSSLVRTIETCALRGSPDRIFRDLGWQAETSIADVIRMMVDADIKELSEK